jgi:MFS family permease
VCHRVDGPVAASAVPGERGLRCVRAGSRLWQRRSLLGLSRPLDRVAYARPELPPQTRRGLKLFWLDGLFIALSFSFYSSFVPLLLLALGASNSQVGFLSSASSLSGIGAYLVASRVTMLAGSRKRVVVFARFSSRLVLLALALIPIVLAGQQAIAVVIGLSCLQVICENIGAPAWTALVADIVPLPIRARYVASRNIAKSAARMIGVAVAGWLIRSLGFPYGYQAAFTLAAAFGLVAAWAYAGIPVEQESTAAAQVCPAERLVLSSRRLQLYIVARAVWALGYHIAAPFYGVYVVRALGGTASTVGLLSAVGAVAAVLGLFAFGRAVEAYGLKRLWLVAGLGECAVPLLWAVAPVAWLGALPAAIDGLILAGLELVNLNTLLILVEAKYRTEFAALHSAIISVGMLLGPMFGGRMADMLGFRPVFVGSAAVLAIGVALYWAFVPETPLEELGQKGVPVALQGG